MQVLKASIVDFKSETEWKWNLSSPEGTFIASHEVELDKQASEFAGYLDLHDYLSWHAEPYFGAAQEDAAIELVGAWIRDQVWGPLADAILEKAEQEPLTLWIEVPPAAETLLYRPFELAFATSSAEAASDVSLVLTFDDKPSREKNPIGDHLRMLALFSTPADQAALNTRHERRKLRRLVEQVALAFGLRIELRILQYGVTRKLVEQVLDEGEGWDLIHFSGHGLPSGLVLENQDGTTDLIRTDEFTQLLRPVRGQLKLVTLSSCESGAVTAERTLRMLGVADHERAPKTSGTTNASALPAAAQNLSRSLGCAVLAMRFPVEDDFAIGLSEHLYEGLLARGQEVPLALQRALKKTRSTQGASDLSVATPALFGAAALNLRINPPPGQPRAFDPANAKMAYFEPEPEHFVGRVAQLSRATAALAPDSRYRAVVFQGMAGAGKTACALELAYRHEQRRFEGMAWHRAPSEGQAIDGALAKFAIDLGTQLEGLDFAHLVNDSEELKKFLPVLRRLLTERSMLVVVDNAESLLYSDGTWRDERWGDLVDAFSSHEGLSRLVLTSRVLPAALGGRATVLTESIDSLSASESALLARRLPNLGRLISDEAECGQPQGRLLVRRALEIVQGNPKLIALADSQAADAKALEQRIAEADSAWAKRGDLAAFFRSGEADEAIAAEDFLRILERWTKSIAKTLPEEIRITFQILCCLEPSDRRGRVIQAAWPMIWKVVLESDEPPEPDAALGKLVEQGLIDLEDPERSATYRIHPAVEHAEREVIEDDLKAKTDIAMAMFWGVMRRGATEQRQTGLIAVAGLSAAPYFLRQKEVGGVVDSLTAALRQDPSPQTVANTLSYLNAALSLAKDPVEQRRVRGAMLQARAIRRDGDVISEIRDLLEEARQDDDYVGYAVLRSNLFYELLRIGRLEDAQEVISIPLEGNSEVSIGEWNRIADEGRRLQVMEALGESEKVLEEIQPLLDRIDQTNEDPQKNTIKVDPWNAKESVLGTGRVAAKTLKQWEKVLEFNGLIHQSEKDRRAPEFERARTTYNEHSALIELGRLEEAEKKLRWVREVAERNGDLRLLGNVLTAWGALAHKSGRIEEAIAFDHRSLKLDYSFRDPELINIGHHNLATHLESAQGDPDEIVAHRLAEVLISYLTSSQNFKSDIQGLTHVLRRYGPTHAPASFQELCTRLQESAEVDFRQFFERLARADDGDEALEALLAAVRKVLDQLDEDSPGTG